MRFTVADVERFKNLLKHAEPTYHECMPPLDPLPSSSIDAYTLYSAHEFDAFLDALNKRNEHMARYVLNASGELCFGYEGDPGIYTPEHWQMLGEDTMMIAAGNIFITDRKITSLSDQSTWTTGFLSLIYTFRTLYENDLPLALNLELIQSVPNKNGEYSSFMTRADLQNIIGYGVECEHDTNGERFDEGDVRPPTPHPFGPFGFFYNHTDPHTCIHLNQVSPTKHDFADVPETKTIAVEAPTW